MVSVAECLRAHAPAYLAKFGDRVPIGHRKVLSALSRCRTGALGGVVYQCDGCGRQHWVGRSCGNRHCPNCQKQKTSRWLARQTMRLLSVHHFLVTFTVPAELRLPLRSCQGEGYRALIDAAADSLRDVASATKSLKNCRLGYFAVLHTWGRDPTAYHPHVHLVVAGGGVRLDSGGKALAWQPTPENFLVDHGTPCRVYKAKLADGFRACGIYDQADQSAWTKQSVVDIKPVGDGTAVLKYLAPYIHRVAISDKRIVACDDSTVTFTVTPSGSKQTKTRTLSGERFVGGFCQHVLPRGFQKVRYYGYLAPNSRIDLDEVKWLVWLYLGWTYWLASGHAPQADKIEPTPVRCAQCGQSMRIVGIVHSDCRALVEHSLAYLDSG